MATTANLSSTQPIQHNLAGRLTDVLAIAIAAGLPLGLFGLANLAGESLGLMPLFFAPYGLPGWAGAALHLSLLPLVGVAGYLASRAGGHNCLLWAAALVAGILAFPFAAPFLDSLQLSMLAVGLLLVAGATTYRVSRVSRTAGLVMIPALIWLGISAALGLALAAAWSPPFALMQGQNNGMPPQA